MYPNAVLTVGLPDVLEAPTCEQSIPERQRSPDFGVCLEVPDVRSVPARRAKLVGGKV